MMDTRELQRIEQAIATAQSDKARAEGALEGVMKRLKEDFDLNSLEEAEAEMIRLNTQIATLDSRAEASLSDLSTALAKAQA